MGDAFRRRRMTEVKHGRASMIACIGYIVPEYFKWPGYCSPSAALSFGDIPNGLAALSKVPAVGWTLRRAQRRQLHDRRREQEDQAECRAGQRQAGDDGDNRHVFSRRPDRQRLGRLGIVHRFPSAVSRSTMFEAQITRAEPFEADVL